MRRSCHLGIRGAIKGREMMPGNPKGLCASSHKTRERQDRRYVHQKACIFLPLQRITPRVPQSSKIFSVALSRTQPASLGSRGRLKPHELATFDRDTIVYHILFSTRDDSPHWIDLPKRNGDETFELPITATFTVDRSKDTKSPRGCRLH